MTRPPATLRKEPSGSQTIPPGFGKMRIVQVRAVGQKQALGSRLWAPATRRPLKSRQTRLACKKSLRIKRCWRFLNGAPLLDCDEISTRRAPRTSNVNSGDCHVEYVEIRQKCGEGTPLGLARCTNIGHNPVDRLHCADSKQDKTAKF